MKLYMVINEVGLEGHEYVEGVYTTIELAEHAAKLYGGARVSETLADFIPEHPEGHYPYDVVLYRDGKLLCARLTNIKEFQEGAFTTERHYESIVGFYACFAKDKEDAVQKAREEGAKRIKAGEWPPGPGDKDVTPMGSA